MGAGDYVHLPVRTPPVRAPPSPVRTCEYVQLPVHSPKLQLYNGSKFIEIFNNFAFVKKNLTFY